MISVVDEPEVVVRSIKKQRPLKALQEKGQQVLRKLAHNNDKMWDQYPTPLFQDRGKEQELGGFLQKTANMWNDKSSDFFAK